MKKIIGTLFIVFICFFGFSRGRTYYTNNSAACSGDGKYYTDSGACGSCKLCSGGVLFGSTGNIGNCGVEGNRKCCVGNLYGSGNKYCCEQGKVVVGNKCKTCQSLTSGDINTPGVDASICSQQCADSSQEYKLPNGLTGCCAGVVENGECKLGAAGAGLRINTRCLLNGQCGMNVYTMLGIRESNENPTVMGLIQDVVLAATTFVGTLIVIALVVSGLMFAMASISGKDTKRAKTIIIDCFVGLLLVMGAYAIVRLIQFLAMATS